MTKLRGLAGLVVCACLTGAAPVYADAVTFWNEITMREVTLKRPGPHGLLDAALVHAAVHDAVQAIEGRFEPYAYSDPTRLGIGSPAAAAAAAAHGTLVRLYPDRQGILDADYGAYLAANNLAGDAGLATGEAAAGALHPAHYRPVIAMDPFFGGTAPGEWRSTVPMAFLYAAFSKPFTLNRTSQFRPEPPPPLTSITYARDYDEVKALGSAAAHPNPQTDTARFWSVNFVTQWNDALRGVADMHVADIGDSARLFALANLAAADAFMAVWDSKYHYNWWRPSTAIHEGDNDGNMWTIGDGSWLGLIADPPYPDYVSGANGLTGAFTRMLQLFFGSDELVFSVKTTHPLVTNKERQYTRCSDAAQEVVDARVLLGIHFRYADEEGRRLGRRVAHWTFMNFLRPAAGSQSAR